jgi:hypothetical protein
MKTCVNVVMRLLHAYRDKKMVEQYETIKIRKSTKRELKMLAAIVGVTMIELLDSLVSERRLEIGRDNLGSTNSSGVQNQSAPHP